MLLGRQHQRPLSGGQCPNTPGGVFGERDWHDFYHLLYDAAPLKGVGAQALQHRIAVGPGKHHPRPTSGIVIKCSI